MNFIEQLKKERASFKKRIDAIDVLLESYTENFSITENNPTQSPNLDKFPKNGKYLEQIIYVIKMENRFIHVSEIVETIAPYYIDKDKKWLKRRISAVLSTAKSKGEISNLISFNYSPSKRDTVWGSKDWLDNDGNIKPEYMYKSKSGNIMKKPSL